MNEITRFDRDMDGEMEPSEHGQWVLYDDVRPHVEREWVGLTPHERLMCRSYDPEETVAKTEAKLKEKNT